MNKLKSNKFSFSYFDFMGVNFNFLIDGKDKHRTGAGGFVSFFMGLTLIILFIFYGSDIFERKMPFVTINSSVGQYPYIKLNNNNFTYAYRLEDSLNKFINDRSKFRTYHTNFHYYQENDTWYVGKYDIIESKLCNSFPNYHEKEKLFNISLEHWFCIDFDNLNLGGLYNTDSVYGIGIQTVHCSNATTSSLSFKCEEGVDIHDLF